MKKILPVICGNGDVQAINTTQVAGTTMTVGDAAAVDCTCDECYGIPSLPALNSCILACEIICYSANS